MSVRVKGALATVIVGVALGYVAASSAALATVLLVTACALLVLAATKRAEDILFAWVVVFATLGDRLFLMTSLGGGSGRLPVGTVVSVLLLLGTMAVKREWREALSRLLRGRVAITLFLVTTTVLPVVGVFSGFQTRTLLAMAVPLASLGFAVFGMVLAGRGVAQRRLLLALQVAVTLNFAAAALQALALAGIVRQPAWLAAWDLRTATSFGHSLVMGRSIGLYENPNVLGLLAVVAIVVGLTVNARLWTRLSLLLPGAAVLVLSQSRGALLGVIAAIAAIVSVSATSSLRSSEARGGLRLVRGVALALIAGAVALQAATFLAPDIPERLTAPLMIFTRGVGSEPNLAARVGFWRVAEETAREYPLGTWGPPETVTGIATDSDYVRYFLQGGLPLLFAYLAVYVSVVGHARRLGEPYAPLALAVALAVSAVSQNNSMYVPFISFFWLFAGAWLGRPETSPVALPAPGAADGAGVAGGHGDASEVAS